jgi:tRNA-dihydrouridine synthase B
MCKKLYRNIKIGKLTIPNFMAAPLDGITDSPFRQLIREFSPNELLMTEMRHVSFVANEKIKRCLECDEKEQPLAFQFSANKIDFIEKAVDLVLEHGFVMINLNCGCPSKSVVKSGSGVALMKEPERLKIILECFYKAIGGKVPFTLKMRAGFKTVNALEIAQVAQDCGIDAIIIHPRTQPGGFSSILDFDLVKKIKQKVSVPVVFSGNLKDFNSIQKTYGLTGVDGFMIGRALWGAPWKLKEIKDSIESVDGRLTEIPHKKILSYAIKHLDLNLKYYGVGGFNAFKKHVPQYVKKTKNAAQWRVQLLRSQSSNEMFDIFNTMPSSDL